MSVFIAIVCPDCAARLKLAEEALGNPLKCPKCARTFRVRPKGAGESGAVPKLVRPPAAAAPGSSSSLTDQISGSVPKLTGASAGAATTNGGSAANGGTNGGTHPPDAQLQRPHIPEVVPDSSSGTDRSAIDLKKVTKPGETPAAPPPAQPTRKAMPGGIELSSSDLDATEGGEPSAPALDDEAKEIFFPTGAGPGDSVVPFAEAADPLIGRVLGGYRLKRMLGRGGRGLVYEAEDVMLGRPAAVKLLAPEVTTADPASADRFLLEARAAAKLDHPNIVGVYAVGRDADLVFTAMALVKGRSLAEELEQHGKFPVAEAVRVIRLAAKGLAAAHAVGVIHRDVKPANILLGDDHSVKVADFGLAKIVDEALTRLTAVGKAVGTPQYMSPEQCRGEEVDARADIYSLGATFFHLLTGQAPFTGGTSAVVARRQVTEPHPDPRKLNPAIPHAIVKVVDKAMCKNPAGRYLTIGEMIAALKTAEGGAVAEELSASSLPPVEPEPTHKTVVLDEQAVLDMLKGEDEDEDSPSAQVEAARLVPPPSAEMSGRVRAISALGAPGSHGGSASGMVPPRPGSSGGISAVRPGGPDSSAAGTGAGGSSARVNAVSAAGAGLSDAPATAAFRLLYDGVNHAKVALGLLPVDVRSSARKVITPRPPTGSGASPGVMLDIAVQLPPDMLVSVARTLIAGGGTFVGLNTEDRRLGPWLQACISPSVAPGR